MGPAPPRSWDQDRIDAALRDMFSMLCAQPLPGRLLSIAEQLDEGDVEDSLAPRRGVG